MRIVALITVALLLAGCAASSGGGDFNAYAQNRCLGGVGDPGPCYDNPGLPSSGGGPGFAPSVGVAR